jgi:hypothetical protein
LCRRDAGQVLAPQAGPLSAGADALDSKRRARGQGEREGGADDQPAALAVRAVDGQHGPIPAQPSFPAASLAAGRRAIRRPAAPADPTQAIHYTRRVPKARDKACVTDERLRFTAEVPVEAVDLPAPRLAGPDAPDVRRAREAIASRMR